MSFEFTLDDMNDLGNDDDSPLPSPGMSQAILRGYDESGSITSTTASDLGYANQQVSVSDMAKVYQGVPTYGDQQTMVEKQEFMMSQMLGTSISGSMNEDGTGGLGAGFDSLTPSDVRARARAVGPLEIENLIGDDGSTTGEDDSSGDGSGEAPAAGGGGAGEVPGGSNEIKIWNFLRNTGGFTQEQTAGIMGNIQAESGFDPGIEEDPSIANGRTELGYGICQWTFGRRTNLESYASGKGKPASDLTTQLEFLMVELNAGYKVRVLDPIRASSDIEEPTKIFLFHFEIPANKESKLAGRIDFARAIYSKFKDLEVGGTVPIDGGGSGSAPAAGGVGSTGINISTQTIRNWWAPACNVPLRGFKLHGGMTYSVHAEIWDAVSALNSAMVKYDYKATESGGGAYNCRQITGGSGYSLHSYGIALDINPTSNPYSSNFKTNMPGGMVQAIKAIRTKNGKQVWRWGGDYRSTFDTMHFEIICSRPDIATGLDPKTLPR